MRATSAKVGASAVKALSAVLFNLGILSVISRFANRFRPDRDDDRLGVRILRRRNGGSVQILLYHRVNDERDLFFPGTPIKSFTEQMEYLAENHNVLELEEAVQRMKDNDIPDNAIVVTFDDGYRDNFLNAFPVLQRLRIPATIFVATDAVHGGKRLWHDRVFSAFRDTRTVWLDGVGISSAGYPLRTVKERLGAQGHVLRFLRSVSEIERNAWIERLMEKLQIVEKDEMGDLMLSWQDIRIMRRSGISFGSHTMTHPVLSQISSDRAREEIWGSKTSLETRLGCSVRTFAYPNGAKGDYDETSKQILREAGYICAVTTTFGTNGRGQDVFELRRGTPWELDLPTFALKLNWYRFAS